MFSPSSSESNYIDLHKNVIRQMKSAKIQHQILEAVQHAYEDALAQNNIILSRAERKRLFTQVTKTLLEDLLQKLDGYSTAET
jgi:hypothetical protein